MIEFQARIRDVGSAYLVTVPATYIKDGHLEAGKIYRFAATKVEENAEQPE